MLCINNNIIMIFIVLGVGTKWCENMHLCAFIGQCDEFLQ